MSHSFGTREALPRSRDPPGPSQRGWSAYCLAVELVAVAAAKHTLSKFATRFLPHGLPSANRLPTT
jgi:hypothetical protein